jgi:hypothetical protein
MNKISKFLIGLFVIGVTASCSSPMDEITELGINRNFAPVALTAKVVNKTNVKLEWNKSDAESYTIEVFYEDPDFAGTPIMTISGLTNADIPFTVEGLEGETEYFFRVKAVGGNLSDSKWSTISATTDTEQIFYPVDEENDVTSNTITVRWPAGSTATKIVVTPGDKEFDVTADAIKAGEFTVTGLEPETEYTIKLMNGTKTRGTIKAKTAIDLGGAILVKPGDDLKAKLDAAVDGDVFAFMPGTYSILNAEEQVTTYEITKKISFKSVRSYDRAVIKAGFILSQGSEFSVTQIVLDGDKTVGNAISYAGTAAGTEVKLVFDDCEVTGFKTTFITDAKADIVGYITINNSIIHDMPLGNRCIDFQGGAIAELLITNSTIYNVSGGDSFVRNDDKGTYKGKLYVNIDHCTLDGFNTTGKGILYVRKGAKTGDLTMSFTNNIVSNSSGVFCNFTPVVEATFEHNNYFNSPNLVQATATETAKYFDNAGTAYDPQYADYTKFDFTVGSDDVKALKIGDPRWIK